MPLPQTQSVWALDHTTKTLLKVSQGLIKTATSDNIEPSALMACQSFGSLLQVYQKTQAKVELLARQHQKSHVRNYLYTQIIGYKKDDSVEELSKTESGIRFLCLATTFCTMPLDDAAILLKSLLHATKSQGQSQPTFNQLRDVMLALENKLAPSDFMPRVLYWNRWYDRVLEGTKDESFRSTKGFIPPRAPLQEIILFINETVRLGQKQCIFIGAKAAYVPWLIAFVEWLLGSLPFIQLANKRVLHHQKEAEVIIVVHKNTEENIADTTTITAWKEDVIDLSVSISYYYENLKSLIAKPKLHESPSSWRGLVDARLWATDMCEDLFNTFPELPRNHQLLKACSQLICFVVSILPDRLECGFSSEKQIICREADGISAPDRQLRMTPFPNSQVRLAIARKLVGQKIPLDSREEISVGFLRIENIRTIMQGKPGLRPKARRDPNPAKRDAELG